MTKEQLLEIKKIGIPSEELFQEVCNKLLGYKQLEEEIGCSLDVFIKLLKKQECYFKEEYVYNVKTKGTIDMRNIDFEKKRFKVWYKCIDGSNDYVFLFFEDYKKYWWLSK